MIPRRHPVFPARGRARARAATPRGWRATTVEEIRAIGAWFSARMTAGFEWLLQLGLPTAATVLEMQNLKRRIPEIGEIDQAMRSLQNGRAGAGPPPRASHQQPMPFG